MNANEIASGKNGDAPAANERRKDKICWPCILAAVPPLLLTLLFAWFAAEALERGRDVAGLTGADVEAPETSGEAPLGDAALRRELAETQEQLAAARIALYAKGPEAANAAGSPAGSPLPGGSGDEAFTPAGALAAIKALAPQPRQDFYAALPDSREFSVWFEALPPEEKRVWIESLIGVGALDPVEIDGRLNPAGVELARKRRAEIESLTEERDAARKETEETRAALAKVEEEREAALKDAAARQAIVEEREKALGEKTTELSVAASRIAELEDKLAQEQEALAKETKALGSAKTELETARAELEAARERTADLQEKLIAESKARSDAQAILERLKQSAKEEAEAAAKREAAIARERDEAQKNLEFNEARLAEQFDLMAELKKRAEDAEAALKDADAPEGSTVPNATRFMSALGGLTPKAKDMVYAEILSGLGADADFARWFSSDEARALRAAFAGFAPGGAASGDAPPARDAAALLQAQTALAKAESTLEEAEKLRAEAEIESKRLAAKLASREARIVSMENSAQSALKQAEKTAEEHQAELEKLSAELAAAKRAASAIERDQKTASSTADAALQARILQLEADLKAAPSAEHLRGLEKGVSALKAETEKLQEALKEAEAGRTASNAALGRLKSQMAALSRKSKANAAATSAPSRAAAGSTPVALTLPEIGEVSIEEAPEAVGRLLSEKSGEARRLRAALAAAEARTAPVGGSDAASPGADDRRLKALRSANAALQARLADAPAGGAPVAAPVAAPEAPSTLTLPEIGPVEPEKAPEEVAKLLALRDRDLQALRAENASLKAKAASAEPSATGDARSAPEDRRTSSAYPNWSPAPIQEVAGDSLAALSGPIGFDSASAELTKEGRAAVRKLARGLLRSLKKAPKEEWRLLIEGHTDQRPIRTREYASNWDLSAARASAVAWELHKIGVPPSRIMTVGRAASDPIDARWTRAAFAKNRRIELSLLRRTGSGGADEK